MIKKAMNIKTPELRTKKPGIISISSMLRVLVDVDIDSGGGGDGMLFLSELNEVKIRINSVLFSLYRYRNFIHEDNSAR